MQPSPNNIYKKFNDPPYTSSATLRPAFRLVARLVDKSV